jgi:hypothetical protein
MILKAKEAVKISGQLTLPEDESGADRVDSYICLQ